MYKFALPIVLFVCAFAFSPHAQQVTDPDPVEVEILIKIEKDAAGESLSIFVPENSIGVDINDLVFVVDDERFPLSDFGFGSSLLDIRQNNCFQLIETDSNPPVPNICRLIDEDEILDEPISTAFWVGRGGFHNMRIELRGMEHQCGARTDTCEVPSKYEVTRIPDIVEIDVDGSQVVVNAENIPSETYLWDFGDGNGNTYEGQETTHSYVRGGDYTLTLRVTIDDVEELFASRIRVVPPGMFTDTTLDFYIHQTEVTHAMYQMFVEDGGYDNSVYWDNEGWARVGDPQNGPHIIGNSDDDYPIAGVSWYEAMAYCNWLGGTLPTESQWMEAAWVGNTNGLYPWGSDAYDDGNDLANLNSDETRPVTHDFTTNSPLFLHDMAGNVREWVRFNSEAEQEENQRITKGGSFESPVNEAEIEEASRQPPLDLLNKDTGFRCIFMK